jgi:hypothetical protein
VIILVYVLNSIENLLSNGLMNQWFLNLSSVAELFGGQTTRDCRSHEKVKEMPEFIAIKMTNLTRFSYLLQTILMVAVLTLIYECICKACNKYEIIIVKKNFYQFININSCLHTNY